MRDLLVAAAVIAVLPFCVARPWIGVLAWSWLGYMNPHRLTFGFAATFPFAFTVAGATLVGMIFARDRKPIPWVREPPRS